MSTINEEMKAIADYAIKASRERYGQELDFSENSIDQLNHILEKIYWDFSYLDKNTGERDLIYQAAKIWGSYLGEYMRRKWGGTWILKESARVISIQTASSTNIEISPISFVYQKITSNPKYNLNSYLLDMEIKIFSSRDLPEQSQDPWDKIIQSEENISLIKPIKPLTINKNILMLLAGIAEVIFIILACIIGYRTLRTGSSSVFGFKVSGTSADTFKPIEIAFVTTTTRPGYLQSPTETPSLTPSPSTTFTPSPTLAPSQTHTQVVAIPATYTYTPVFPTHTQTPSPTSSPRIPTKTPIPPTEPPQPPATEPPQPSATQLPQPTATARPQPTATQPPPVRIDSCDIDPSTVPVGINVTITFIVRFSAPGYGFDSSSDSNFNGTQDCSGVDSDGDGVAYCDGSSGELPTSSTVFVTLSSAAGDCVVSYSSQ